MFPVALAVALTATACGTTVDEPSADSSPPRASAPVATARTDRAGSVPGSADDPVADVLSRIGDEMSRLSAQIGDDGDEDATLARIDELWASARDEIGRDRPSVADDVQTTIDMARVAVERNRPADADKAFRLFTDIGSARAGG